MGNYRWGILGVGEIAESFAKALNDSGATLHGVGSRTYSRAKAFAERFGIKNCYESASALLDDPEIDIVYIGVTNDAHYQYLMEAIEKGKHVLCEKPFVINSKQLEEVLAAAKKKNVVVEEAMTIFHMPLYKKLRGMIEEGFLGEIKMIQVSFGSYKTGLDNRFFKMDAAGGAMLDIGCYATSFMRVFLEEIPDNFSAFVKLHETGVDEEWVIGMENEVGQLVSMNLTFCAKQPKRGVISGEKGYIEIENYPRADKAKVFFVADGKEEIITAGETRLALRYEIEDMEELVANPRKTKAMELTCEVVKLMSDIRERYGPKFPCE